ncbi:hypothetical protein ALC57_16367 [Trachymyrmex cornetzi]|uniref:Uncharacterized protein n=1 Tax=Trachymyrmex cornetzi TaxID=471704 RepID=A0A151IVD7_9HYME|nr:hypothetical protein ALC57_16367 [Trachymyrmex cornetzi]
MLGRGGSGRITEEIEGEEEEERRSKNSKVNKEGRKLVGIIRERGWAILNGNIKGDEEGNWTYTGGRGEYRREKREYKELCEDWKRRVWLFDKLIWAMVSYGVEIWGWKERETVESLQERYLRWVLGVERRTPGYLVREELQREKLRAKAGKRAWAFEERLRREGGSRLVRLCWEEAMGNLGKEEKLEGWEREREQYFVERGVQVNREGGRVAKFRLGNEVKEERYWEEEEERKCRLCGSGWETWEHIWEGCRAWKMGEGGSWQEVVGRILGEEGEGEGWMREVEEERKRMREEGGVGEGKND